MDHGQLILNALSSVGTHDGLEQILEHTIELAAGAILFAIIVRLGNTIYNIARRIIGASIDNVAQMRSSWAKRRVRYILDVYSHDLRLRNNTIELVSWASCAILMTIFLLSMSLFLLIALPDGTFFAATLFIATWIVAFSFISKLDRIRDPKSTDQAARDQLEKAQNRLGKLIGTAGVDNEIRQWWQDTFEEPLDI